MNRRIILAIALISIAIIVMTGCSKSNPAVFSWDYQGRHYVADSSSASAGSVTRIAAYSGVTALGIDGGSQLVAGSYPLHGNNNSSQPFLFYVVGGFTYSQSGTVTITHYDNTKISGYFNTTLTDGTMMSGNFTDIPVR